MANVFDKPVRARKAEHQVVYRNNNEFCSWPFICGLWETAEKHLLVSFMRNPCSYETPADISHDSKGRTRTKFTVLRSEDRGKSWNSSQPTTLIDLAETSEATYQDGPRSYTDEAPFYFNDKNVLVASGAFPDYFQPISRPWIRVSTDGGRNWKPPIFPPMVGMPSLSGHGSAMVRPDGVSLVFMTMVSADGWTRRPVVYASADEGRLWTFLSFMMPAPDDNATERSGSLKFAAHRWFDARPLLLPDGTIVASVRCQRDPTSVLWTEMFESRDGGRTWQFLSRVNDWGAPGDLALLRDGRIICAYGYRHRPYGVRARVSEDNGRTWGAEIVIRDDGGSWDLGYPRIIELEKGKLLTVYYMNLRDDPIQMNGGVRHIAQTFFELD